MSTRPIKVLIPIFPGFNTLDLNGPAEVLGNSALPKDTFTITIASASDLTTAHETITVKRNVSFTDLLSPSNLAQYDALIVPGGPRGAIDAMLQSKSAGGLLDVVAAFAAQPATGMKQKWLISICTGSNFLGATGQFCGKTATTHWAALEKLQEASESYVQKCGGKDVRVVRKRWVDGGKNASGIRIVSSGGVSCGIDCTLWYVSEVVGMDAAVKVSMLMDYDWKFSSAIPVTSGELV